MPKCNCCHRPRPLNLWITGIATRDGLPAAIRYRCTCFVERTIPWTDATEAERGQARFAELSKDAASEMMCR